MFPDAARFFGVSLIEYAVKYKWSSQISDVAEVEMVKEVIKEVLSTATQVATEEEHYMKEKIAKVFVEAAKKLWPLSWMDMDSYLHQLYCQSVKHKELVLLIFKSLSEDVFILEDVIAEKRKKDLSSALVAIVVNASLLHDLYSKDRAGEGEAAQASQQQLDQFFTGIRFNPTGGGWLHVWETELVTLQNGLANSSAPEAQVLLDTLLKLLTVVITWIPLRSLAESSILLNLSNCLSLPNHQIVEALSEFGCRYLLNKKLTTIPPGSAKYFEVITKFSSHPSDSIAANMLTVWSDLFRHEFWRSVGDLKAVSKQLLQYCLDKTLQLNQPKKSILAYYSELDADIDDLDESLAAAQFKSRLSETIRNIANLMPEDVFYFMADICLGLMKGQPANTIPTDSQLDMATSLIETSIKAMKGSAGLNEKWISVLKEFVIAALACDGNTSAQFRLQLSVFSNINELLQADRSLLLQVLEKTLSTVVFVEPDEQNFLERAVKLRESTRIIRLKAITTLIKLGTGMPDEIMELYEPIFGMVSQFASQIKLTDTEKARLTEFLISLIMNSTGDDTRKAQLLGPILNPVVAEWMNITAGLAQSPDMFAASVGLDIVESQAASLLLEQKLEPPLFTLKSKHSKMSLGTETLVQLLKRCQGEGSRSRDLANVIISQMVPAMVERCAIVTRNIHKFLEDGFAGFPAYLSLVQRWKTNTLPENSARIVKSLDTFFPQMRDTCLRLIGATTTLECFFQVPGIVVVLGNNVFDGQQQFQITTWKSILDIFIKSLMANCPLNVRAAVLEPILLSAIVFMSTRVNREITTMNQSQAGYSSERVTDHDQRRIEDEIVADRQLKDCFRSFSDILQAVAVSNGKTNPTSIFESLKARPEFTENYLQSLLQLMKCRDSNATRRVLSTLSLLSQYASEMHFAKFFGTSVLIAIIQIYNDGVYDEVHNDCLVCFCTIYSAVRTTSTISFDTINQLQITDEQSLKNFDQNVMEQTKPKEKMHIARELLRTVKGVSVSQLFKEQANFFQENPKLSRPSRSRDVLDQEGEDVLGILE
ncbi:Exportin-5 [Blyttiomyces sp. JEL0837]|nr:Exportin-5 [Blyttiomyces sp. JEL0837]